MILMAALTEILDGIPQEEKTVVAVAAAADFEVLEAVHRSLQRNLASFRLFDDMDKLLKAIQESHPYLKDHPKIKIHHVSGHLSAAEEAVKSVSTKDSDVLMKGHIPTAVLMKAVLHPEFGLRTGQVLSHVAVFEIENFERLVFVTDAGMNIEPDLQRKAEIIQNAVAFAHSIGVEMPVVAPLAAIEVINPLMQATVDAAALAVMNKRGQITGCIVDGPLALDNAISLKAAKHKGISTKSAGIADILLVPTIESGNILYKSLVYFSKAKVGGVIVGAKAPIVLTSRADSAETKLFSLALAIRSSSI